MPPMSGAAGAAGAAFSGSHQGLGGQDHGGDGRGVLECAAADLGRVDDAVVDHVAEGVVRGVVAVIDALALADLIEDDRTLDTGVGRDLADRGTQRGSDDVCTGLLVAGELGSRRLCGLAGHDICRAAAGDNALFNSRAGSVERVLDAQLLFLHLGLGRSADLDDRNTAGELCQTLLQLLLVILGGGRLDLGADLCDTALDVVLGAGALDDGRGLLGDLDLTRVAKL